MLLFTHPVFQLIFLWNRNEKNSADIVIPQSQMVQVYSTTQC